MSKQTNQTFPTTNTYYPVNELSTSSYTQIWPGRRRELIILLTYMTEGRVEHFH